MSFRKSFLKQPQMTFSRDIFSLKKTHTVSSQESEFTLALKRGIKIFKKCGRKFKHFK